MHRLPPAAIAALERGSLIEAIKLTREATGLDLKASKELVERHGNSATADDAVDHLLQSRPSTALPPEAMAALRRGQVVEAVKLTREATGLGLKESKDLVDAVRSPDGAAAHRAAAGEQSDPMHEPGRVRGGTNRTLIVSALLCALVLAAWVVAR